MYALAGCVGFWIDTDWKMVEIVLDLLALDSDHSGAVTGKLVFNVLHACGASKKLSASYS
jgi:hypothetical protein